MASEPKESASNNPGLYTTPAAAAKGYIMQQTMFRIKDPKVSLDFYSRFLGMSILHQFQVTRLKEQFGPLYWGTESDPDFKGYHNGNSEPRGFGHIGVAVDDTYKTCERFERLGVEFVEKPDDGNVKGVAFIKDPDGYWVEIFDLQTIPKITESTA